MPGDQEYQILLRLWSSRSGAAEPPKPETASVTYGGGANAAPAPTRGNGGGFAFGGAAPVALAPENTAAGAMSSQMVKTRKVSSRTRCGVSGGDNEEIGGIRGAMANARE